LFTACASAATRPRLPAPGSGAAGSQQHRAGGGREGVGFLLAENEGQKDIARRGCKRLVVADIPRDAVVDALALRAKGGGCGRSPGAGSSVMASAQRRSGSPPKPVASARRASGRGG
jgi:hypothetical protein